MKLIKNGTVMTMGPQGTLNADILIDNGKIIKIEENITAESAQIIDAAGLLVLPGLVDAHSHIGGFDTKTGAQDLNESVNPVTAQTERLRRRGSVIAAVCIGFGNRHYSQRHCAGQCECDLRLRPRDQVRWKQPGRALCQTAVRAERRRSAAIPRACTASAIKVR